jgi:hypothetical protein
VLFRSKWDESEKTEVGNIARLAEKNTELGSDEPAIDRVRSRAPFEEGGDVPDAEKLALGRSGGREINGSVAVSTTTRGHAKEADDAS